MSFIRQTIPSQDEYGEAVWDDGNQGGMKDGMIYQIINTWLTCLPQASMAIIQSNWLIWYVGLRSVFRCNQASSPGHFLAINKKIS